MIKKILTPCQKDTIDMDTNHKNICLIKFHAKKLGFTVSIIMIDSQLLYYCTDCLNYIDCWLFFQKQNTSCSFKYRRKTFETLQYTDYKCATHANKEDIYQSGLHSLAFHSNVYFLCSGLLVFLPAKRDGCPTRPA